MTTLRRICRSVGVVCAVLGIAAVARAQSPVEGFNPGVNSEVMALAVQADGKILVGGFFTTLGGGGFGTTTRNYIGRLNADGSLDTSFNPGANGVVWVLTVQADGKILVGGRFTALGGGTGTTPRMNIGRLNADGSVDMSFNPGANLTVTALVEQADGKILVGGLFTGLGGGTGTTPRNAIGRLDAAGAIDPGFNQRADRSPESMPASIETMAIQTDGKIVVGGVFSALGGDPDATRSNVGRLNADGSLDATFSTGGPAGGNGVPALAVQPDGKILIGGCFTAGVCTAPHRLNSDGSLDTTFKAGIRGGIYAFVVQADG